MGLPYHRGKKQRSELASLVGAFCCCTFVLPVFASPSGQSLGPPRKTDRRVRQWRNTAEGCTCNPRCRETLLFFRHALRRASRSVPSSPPVKSTVRWKLPHCYGMPYIREQDENDKSGRF